VWTRDVARGRRIAARVEAGKVNVNDGNSSAGGSVGAPMGGFKASGLGRRPGREGVEALTEAQTISVQRGENQCLTLYTLYQLGGGCRSKVLTSALDVMRRLRMP